MKIKSFLFVLLVSALSGCSASLNYVDLSAPLSSDKQLLKQQIKQVNRQLSPDKQLEFNRALDTIQFNHVSKALAHGETKISTKRNYAMLADLIGLMTV